MIVQQVSVFLENKIGRLNEVTQVLGKNGINISAFSIADTSDFGILRMIVADPEKAIGILKENGFSAKTTDVVLLNAPNKPGALAKALEVLNSEEVFIEYMYAFSMNERTSVIVIKPSDPQMCLKKLEKHKDELISGGDPYNI
ncbi:MAG: ACT domain-containing protein [Prolixibacteraceae bacterium]|nr:ACT domain-containing protein [Prolixibacteraceae bacterium]MBN2775041.1 ACT domain-containing protein [Prolixibacteraceae bacterium]